MLRVDVEVDDRVDGVGGTEAAVRKSSAGTRLRACSGASRDDQADTAVNPDGHVDQRQGGDLPGAGAGDVGADHDQDGPLKRVVVPPYWRVRRSRSA